MSFGRKQMKQETIMLSETSQDQTAKHHICFLLGSFIYQSYFSKG